MRSPVTKGLEGAVAWRPPKLALFGPKGVIFSLLVSRTIKNTATNLGIYSETLPAFGFHGPPEFGKMHF